MTHAMNPHQSDTHTQSGQPLGGVEMNEPKLNRCPFCGSSDVATSRDWTYYDTTCRDCGVEFPVAHKSAEDAIKAWNESYVAKAMETLADVLHDGGSIRQDMGFVWLQDIDGMKKASGETMLDMVMNLQDKVTK